MINEDMRASVNKWTLELKGIRNMKKYSDINDYYLKLEKKIALIIFIIIALSNILIKQYLYGNDNENS